MSRLFNFLPGDLPMVHGAPGEGDVGDHERDEEGDPEHHFQREVAGGAVPDGQGALEVGEGRIISRPVETSQEEDGHHHEDGTGEGEPEAPAVLRERAQVQAREHKQDSPSNCAAFPPLNPPP